MAVDPRDAPRAAGVEGDGLDTYPTYRDGPAGSGSAGPTSGLKPTDVGLPRSRRTTGLPIFLGLIAFGIAILAYLILGGSNMLRTTGQAMAPGQPAASTTSGASATQGAQTGVATGSTNAGQQAGPGAVTVTPGPTDVPGGATTSPAQTAPAQ